MKKWFDKFPYPGWFLLIVISGLLAVGVYFHEKNQFRPENFAAKIQYDFSKKEATFIVDGLTGYFQKSLNDSSFTLNNNIYFCFISRDGEIINWNTNEINLSDQIKNNPDSFLQGTVVTLNHTVLFLRTWKINDPQSDNSYAFVLIPLAYQYAIENKYFTNRFVADKHVPTTTKIHNKDNPIGIAINNSRKIPVFYLEFDHHTHHHFTLKFWSWITASLFLVLFFIWVHKCCLHITKNKKTIYGWFLLLAILSACYLTRYFFGIPIGFYNSIFFSPKLLAYGNFLHSFGDLTFFCIFQTWLLFFWVKYVYIGEIINYKSEIWRWITKLSFLLFCFYILYFEQASLVYKLILDSKIPFEVSDFSKLSIFTFLGIAVLTLITIGIIYLIYIINEITKSLWKNKWISVFVFIILSLFFLILRIDPDISIFYIAIFIFTFSIFLIVDYIGLPAQLFSKPVESTFNSNTFIWFFILSSWITLQIFYFNYNKEKDLRKIYASKQEQRDDVLISYAFQNLAEDLRKDPFIKKFWSQANATEKDKVAQHILYGYLGAPFNEFKTTLYFYDSEKRPLYHPDSLDILFIENATEILGEELKEGIVNTKNELEKNIYWGFLPISNSADSILGYIGFDFSIDKRPHKNYLTSIIQQNYNPSDQLYFDKYSHGIYKNGNLWAQGGTQIFPYKIIEPTQKKEVFFKETLFESTLNYQISESELIQVHFKRNIISNLITLFSYVLAVVFLLGSALLGLNLFIFYPRKGKIWRRRKLNFTIRGKVNITILFTVFLSLTVVGILTITFLNNRYKDVQQKNLKNLMFFFSQNIIDFLEKNRITLNSNEDNTQIYEELNLKLNILSTEQGVDIHLFNEDGQLISTSQNDLLHKGFITNLMNREVFLELKSGMKSDLIKTEQLGLLKYESLYLPLRDGEDQIIGYLNLPYYASQEELKEEVSNILATLINIYTLMFFISGISAILISNSIIKSFKLLIKQFRTVRLKHNLLLEWPYRDEIGILVKEYNEMIIKVESMANQLASKEREDAWRELALQVAHEIKNPLTPMKLNIQYLQHAIKSGKGDIISLTSNLTDTLIEQIESLDLIATEFAHFAKMPEANPERLNVHEMLLSIVSLFEQENATIKLISNNKDIHIGMDKGYFRRIFTNIIKNAVQAIPQERSGKIEISYKLIQNKIWILVRDNGIGIPKEKSAQMFTPYFTTKSSGTGIGLSMSKNMVEHSNGRIWFESEEDVGTMFFVEFPVIN